MKKDVAQFLFLDRDGVINTRIPEDYVRSVEMCVLEDGVLHALKILRLLFKRIVVVTNQAGIGKGLMCENDLNQVHQHLQEQFTAHGAMMDGFYHCPNIAADNASCRKPNIGMGIMAQLDFPEIDFTQSWMVGDSNSDIEFGQRLGMKTALVTGKIGEAKLVKADIEVLSLLDFALFVFSKKK
jgi:D-glycero-D-manno-heptose 1,7-bisphosphate phosphatase